MHSIFGLGLRGFLLVASAIVLGVSVTLAKHQGVDAPPPETSFASFTGAFGLLAAAVGVAAMFVDSIPSMVPLVAEGLAGLLFLAGGVVLALALKGVSCTDDSNQALRVRFENKLLNGGCVSSDDCSILRYSRSEDEIKNELKARCVRVQVDFAFQFIAFITALGAVAITFLTAKRSGTRVLA